MIPTSTAALAVLCAFLLGFLAFAMLSAWYLNKGWRALLESLIASWAGAGIERNSVKRMLLELVDGEYDRWGRP